MGSSCSVCKYTDTAGAELAGPPDLRVSPSVIKKLLWLPRACGAMLKSIEPVRVDPDKPNTDLLDDALSVSATALLAIRGIVSVFPGAPVVIEGFELLVAALQTAKANREELADMFVRCTELLEVLFKHTDSFSDIAYASVRPLVNRFNDQLKMARSWALRYSTASRIATIWNAKGDQNTLALFNTLMDKLQGDLDTALVALGVQLAVRAEHRAQAAEAYDLRIQNFIELHGGTSRLVSKLQNGNAKLLQDLQLAAGSNGDCALLLMVLEYHLMAETKGLHVNIRQRELRHLWFNRCSGGGESVDWHMAWWQVLFPEHLTALPASEQRLLHSLLSIKELETEAARARFQSAVSSNPNEPLKISVWELHKAFDDSDLVCQIQKLLLTGTAPANNTSCVPSRSSNDKLVGRNRCVGEIRVALAVHPVQQIVGPKGSGCTAISETIAADAVAAGCIAVTVDFAGCHRQGEACVDRLMKGTDAEGDEPTSASVVQRLEVMASAANGLHGPGPVTEAKEESAVPFRLLLTIRNAQEARTNAVFKQFISEVTSLPGVRTLLLTTAEFKECGHVIKVKPLASAAAAKLLQQSYVGLSPEHAALVAAACMGKPLLLHLAADSLSSGFTLLETLLTAAQGHEALAATSTFPRSTQGALMLEYLVGVLPEEYLDALAAFNAFPTAFTAGTAAAALDVSELQAIGILEVLAGHGLVTCDDRQQRWDAHPSVKAAAAKAAPAALASAVQLYSQWVTTDTQRWAEDCKQYRHPLLLQQRIGRIAEVQHVLSVLGLPSASTQTAAGAPASASADANSANQTLRTLLTSQLGVDVSLLPLAVVDLMVLPVTTHVGAPAVTKERDQVHGAGAAPTSVLQFADGIGGYTGPAKAKLKSVRQAAVNEALLVSDLLATKMEGTAQAPEKPAKRVAIKKNAVQPLPTTEATSAVIAKASGRTAVPHLSSQSAAAEGDVLAGNVSASLDAVMISLGQYLLRADNAFSVKFSEMDIGAKKGRLDLVRFEQVLGTIPEFDVQAKASIMVFLRGKETKPGGKMTYATLVLLVQNVTASGLSLAPAKPKRTVIPSTRTKQVPVRAIPVQAATKELPGTTRTAAAVKAGTVSTGLLAGAPVKTAVLKQTADSGKLAPSTPSSTAKKGRPGTTPAVRDATLMELTKTTNPGSRASAVGDIKAATGQQRARAVTSGSLRSGIKSQQMPGQATNAAGQSPARLASRPRTGRTVSGNKTGKQPPVRETAS